MTASMTMPISTIPAEAAEPVAPRFAAVLFDCDGVLVDSERITMGALHEMLGELGWQMPFEECLERFVGHTVRDEADLIEARTGFRISDEWIAEFRARRDAALRERLQPIAGAAEAVAEINGLYSGRIACASSADRPKIELQLAKAGFDGLFGKNVFSGLELPRTKPAPDVYLAAAAELGVHPARTAVIEDSLTGVQAGVAAGARVFGFAPGGPAHRTADELRAAGAHEIFTSMAELPALLGE